MLSAGILGDSPSKLKTAYDAGAGAVVTKSITLLPRPPRSEPTIIRLETGGYINAVGLSNPGAEKFSKLLGEPDYPVIVSLAGSDPSEIASMVDIFDDAACAFEINMSCPNVDGVGADIGDDPKLVANIVRASKSATDSPVFVKIGHHMLSSAVEAVATGADGITAINTIPATAISGDGKAVFGLHAGGLSGGVIKHIALRAVYDLADMCDAPIIGCGGVECWQDAVEFLQAGASAVQIGSAVMMGDVSVIGDVARGVGRWEQMRNKSR